MTAAIMDFNKLQTNPYAYGDAKPETEQIMRPPPRHNGSGCRRSLTALTRPPVSRRSLTLLKYPTPAAAAAAGNDSSAAAKSAMMMMSPFSRGGASANASSKPTKRTTRASFSVFPSLLSSSDHSRGGCGSGRNSRQGSGTAAGNRRRVSSSGSASNDLFAALQSIQAWNQDEKEKAEKDIQDALQEQQNKLQEFEKLIERATEFVAARLDSDNSIGAVLSMKQILKYESLKQQATVAIGQLQEFARQVEEDDHDTSEHDDADDIGDYQAKIEAILAVPAPTVDKQTSAALLELANQRLQQQKPAAVTAAVAAQQQAVGAAA